MSESLLSNYTPTARERITDYLARHWYGDNRAGTRKAEGIMSVLDMTPVGMATSMYDAGRDLGQGNYAMAGLGAGLAALPLPGAIKKDAKKTIRAYHGSPHDFDKFSMDKIGTGEGAQAYGHGLYFAEQEKVAKQYKDQLGKRAPTWASSDAQAKYDPFTLTAIQRELEKGLTPDEIMKMNAQYSEAAKAGRPNIMADMHDALKNGDVKTGSMYEVEINADPDSFLDWDKPLSEQPESVRGVLPDIVTTKGWRGNRVPLRDVMQQWETGGLDPNNMSEMKQTGRDIYHQLNAAKGQAAPKVLKYKGIPGIKYLDAGSRTKGDGSRNYVVFDENLVNIIRKYGLAGLLGGGIGAAATQQNGLLGGGA